MGGTVMKNVVLILLEEHLPLLKESSDAIVRQTITTWLTTQLNTPHKGAKKSPLLNP